MAWIIRRDCMLRFLFSAFVLYAFAPALVSSSSSSPRRGSKVNDRRFQIADDMFWKDGEPFQIIGGDVHYFRVLPQYWEDRLLRAKALGLNTVQTYVPWNLHEPRPRKWVFDGIADIESFLKISQELGFLVMLRIGPYICAEWDLGGFPSWLLAKEPSLRLRSSDSSFLQLVEQWWDILLPMIAPYLYENGGPVIMVQIENEFGSYGDDQSYLHSLISMARKNLGHEAILYTTDGATLSTLEKGSIHGEEVFSAVDFSTGEDAWSIFKMQKMFNAPGKSPPLTTEFYTGWLTHWGESLATTDADFVAQELDKILSRNGSVVLYVAHGGTNFGFFSGANTGQNASDYQPDITSYDYDAPIKEYGDTDNLKFKALRNVIEKYSKAPLPQFPCNNNRTGYGHVKMSKVVSIFEALNSLCDPMEVTQNDKPISMELLGQIFGVLLYMSEYSMKEHESTLSIPKVHDRAQVFISCALNEKIVSPKYVGVIERWSNQKLTIPKLQCSSNISLFILVENMGRVNYGPYIHDNKGILSDVILDSVVLHQWKMFPIDFGRVSKLSPPNAIMQVADSRNDTLPVNSKHCDGADSGIPKFFEGHFTINSEEQVNDTFISLHGWNKGIVFINNFSLGRFWTLVGPQCTLYVPAPILKHGENVVVIFELHAPNPQFAVTFVEQPDFSCGSEP